MWREQQPRRGIPPLDFLLSAPVLLGRAWQQTSEHLKTSLSRKTTTGPPRRIRRAEGWISDFFAYYKYSWCTMMRSVPGHTKKNVKHVSNFKGCTGASFGISLQRALGWVMKPVLLHKSNWLQTSQYSSQEQAATVIFKRNLCFSMIFKSCLPDDLLTQSSNPFVSIRHWVNSSRYFLPLITEICIWFSFTSDLVFFISFYL